MPVIAVNLHALQVLALLREQPRRFAQIMAATRRDTQQVRRSLALLEAERAVSTFVGPDRGVHWRVTKRGELDLTLARHMARKLRASKVPGAGREAKAIERALLRLIRNK